MTRAHRRGPWIPEEDAALMSLVQSQGPNNWVRISQHMHYRSPKQCRERFHQNLKPTLNHEPITADEGEMIEQMVADMGKRWAEIARRLGNRSDNAVKNWWNGSMNRRRRNVIHSSSKTLSNRLEPLSAVRPAITPIPSDHYRRHSHSRSWSGSQHGFSHVSQPYYPQQYTSQPMNDYRSMISVNERRDQLLPSLGLPRPPSAPYGGAVGFAAYSPPEVSSRLPNPFSQTARPAPLVFHPTPQRAIEPPMISPVGSESSLAPLERAPSLISDSNSTSSVSPKTSHSPRPNLPAPIDTRPFSIRRGSTTSLEASAQYHTDEGYVSALPQSASTEGKHFSSQMPVPKTDDKQSTPGRRWSPGHGYSHSASNPTLPPLLEHPLIESPPKSARDTRMTFSSLLN